MRHGVSQAGADLYRHLQSFVGEFVARHGAVLQSLWVDEIVFKAFKRSFKELLHNSHSHYSRLKFFRSLLSFSNGFPPFRSLFPLQVRLGTENEGCQGVLRFTAASSLGEYMKCRGLLEEVEPVTGSPVRWQDLQSGEETQDVQVDALRKRRAVARKAGSTYAPEFLGLLEAALVKIWSAYQRREAVAVPKELLKAQALRMVDNTLKEMASSEASDIGMLAWRLLLRTPEFPQGRSVVLIANDVTHQAGSFGVKEDHFFKQATEYARKRGLPRVYIACNSGARVGLVEEIIPKLQVKWKDAEDPLKGFEYLSHGL